MRMMKVVKKSEMTELIMSVLNCHKNVFCNAKKISIANRPQFFNANVFGGFVLRWNMTWTRFIHPSRVLPRFLPSELTCSSKGFLQSLRVGNSSTALSLPGWCVPLRAFLSLSSRPMTIFQLALTSSNSAVSRTNCLRMSSARKIF